MSEQTDTWFHRNICQFYHQSSNVRPRARLQGWRRRQIQVQQIQERRSCSLEPRHVRPLSSITVIIKWSTLYSYVRSHSCATLTIQRAFFKIDVVTIEIEFKPNELGDYNTIELEGWGLLSEWKALHADCPASQIAAATIALLWASCARDSIVWVVDCFRMPERRWISP